MRRRLRLEVVLLAGTLLVTGGSKDGHVFPAAMADDALLAEEAQTFATPPRYPGPDNVVPAAPLDGGPTNWEVTEVTGGLRVRAQPAATASILGSFPAGVLLDNLGCQRARDGVWCDVQPFGGGPRGYVAAAYLKPAMGPDGNVPTGPETTALRAGEGDFDATGKIPCAQRMGQPLAQCDFAVARQRGGFATVLVTKPDGVKRAIFFRLGVPVGADTSQADGYGEFRVEKAADLNFIRVGDERYEIPDAVVLGG
jgi:hypothetical protein